MQKTSFTCADARHLVHLAVGEDALPDEESQLAEHLHACADCRSYHAGMVDAMQVLEGVRDSLPPEPMPRSLLPAMAGELKVRKAQMLTAPEGRRFNVSVAALCVCSLALALVTAVQNLPSHESQTASGYSVMPAVNVGYAPGEDGTPGMIAPNNYANRLVEVELKDGSRVLWDRATGNFVPTILKSDNEDLNF